MKKSIVDHTYRDYSTATASELLDDGAAAIDTGLFPAKLHVILSTQEHAHIITWKSHGRAWVILDRPTFISVILPLYFDTRLYMSFNRSVNGWGFKVCMLHVCSFHRFVFVCFHTFDTRKCLASPWFITYYSNSVFGGMGRTKELITMNYFFVASST